MNSVGRPRKVTSEQLLNIQNMAKKGMDYLAIAKCLNVNPGSVKYWLNKGF